MFANTQMMGNSIKQTPKVDLPAVKKKEPDEQDLQGNAAVAAQMAPTPAGSATPTLDLGLGSIPYPGVIPYPGAAQTSPVAKKSGKKSGR